jgi:O-antigen/teichoic acid export membrane protein
MPVAAEAAPERGVYPALRPQHAGGSGGLVVEADPEKDPEIDPEIGAEIDAEIEAEMEASGQASLRPEGLFPEPGPAVPQETASPSVRQGGPVPRHVARSLVSGTSALGAGALIERGMGFLANILAARFGGASTFGAYSLGITTAANISTYAAGGIGATAARFSGKYPHGSAGYSKLARALMIVSGVSAGLAAAGLWLGAVPLAHLLGKEALAPLLRFAALSAAGMILLECAKGFFVGQRRLLALLLLSLVVGLGMVLLLPLAASHGSASAMIVSQAGITTGAVVVCLLLARPLGLLAAAGAVSGSDGSLLAAGSVLREVWGFGLVQLAGLVGMNLAGWWLTTLVARADTTLVQMSFFAIANQMRNIVGLGPSLLTESSYSIMAAGERGRAAGGKTGQNPDQAPDQMLEPTSGQTPDQTPDQVMALCTYLATGSALLLSALGILVVPWGLTLLYGHTFRGGALAAAVGLAIAIVHMGNSPAAARLTIVSIKTAGAINTIWAVVVAGAGTGLLLRGGNAWQAMAVYLGAHLISAMLVLAALGRRRCVPAGMTGVLGLGALTGLAMVGLAYLRESQPALAWPATALMLAVLAGAFAALAQLGRRYHWLPTKAALRQMLFSLRARLLLREAAHAA